jgi:RNA polymerase sigma-70 factor (ECF subfamily)
MHSNDKNISGLHKQDFKKLYEDYYADLCRYGRKYIREMEKVEDIVHEVFINLWDKRTTIDTSKPVKSYLYRSVGNRCLNYIRYHKKFAVDSEMMDFGNENIESESMMEATELESKISGIIESLPDRCREIFKLNRFEELKYKEIADKLGISIKTVEVQMSKALKTLRLGLKDYLKLIILFIFDFWR